MLVDWTWMSGAALSIKRTQKLLNVTQDGIVGPKTVAAINNTADIMDKVYEARKNHFEAIVKARPISKKFLKGWINRLNDTYNYDR
ncbi:putative peptidoglycan-binding domain-containing protein [Sharpea azabuensis]|uniref:putative peptidoglycan-binding domain-containing protein n=1 Tax=Sharpea azabuensis TaxID=322505 RepID=UPI0030B91D98